jgi:undecaprenyl-diphosphatase
MSYIYSILTGLLQGLTEFLPISSSGHLVLFHDILGFNLPDNLTFDVILHLGTLGALLLYFYKDVIKYLTAFFASFTRWKVRTDINQRLAWMLVVGTVPAVIAGYFFEDIIDRVFRNSVSVAIMLIVFGIVLYAVDKYTSKEKELNQLNWTDTIVIGLAQALALIPGVSRAGITIIAGITQKLKRETAARFSFLLAMPVVFGAGVKKVLEIESFSCDETVLYIWGFLAALLSGYLTIKYFLAFLQKNTLKFFALYRVILGLIVIVYLVHEFFTN